MRARDTAPDPRPADETVPAPRYASLGARLSALAVDLVGIALAAAVTGVLLGLALPLLHPPLLAARTPPDLAAHLPVVLRYAAIATGLLTVLYWIIPVWLGQATLGLRAQRLKVITDTGDRPGLLRAAWRKVATLAAPLAAVCLADPLTGATGPSALAIALAVSVAGVLLIAVTPRRQALHDLLSGTVVIDRTDNNHDARQ